MAHDSLRRILFKNQIELQYKKPTDQQKTKKTKTLTKVKHIIS